jgi:hypothetical protein
LTVAAVGTPGCTVLTERQVAAVNQFADATKDFATSPGVVITAHAELRRRRGLLEAATRSNGKAAAHDLENALSQQAGLKALAASSDAAMEVLDDYTEMLSLLSSPTFTGDLQNQTIALGNSIDNNIATFNKVSGSNINSFGDVVAGIVRAGGGIWIRHEQQVALKAAVTQADAEVDKLTMAAEQLMDKYLAPIDSEDKSADKLNLFSSELNEVRSLLARPQPAGQHLQFSMLEQSQAAMIQARDGQALATSCKTAAVQYRNAHKELVRAVTDDKTDLKGLVAQIQVLAREVKAGKRVRDEIKRTRND